MLDSVVALIVQAFEACSAWFLLIFERTGMLPFYLAGVIVVFTSGFLLQHFGSLSSGVSDVAAEKIGKGKGKFASGKFVRGNKNYRGHYQKGKFEK